MRALVVWTVGTAYVLAALVGAATIVWAADHRDNSSNPTHWGVGAAIALAPALLAAIVAVAAPRRRPATSRWLTVSAATAATVVAAALAVGAREVVIDATSCGDDDCIPLSTPVAMVCLVLAWSLPFGLSALRRLRYPAPLVSVGTIAALTTSAAGLAATVQRTRQEDNFADLGIGIIVAAWVLPGLVATAVLLTRRRIGADTPGSRPGRVGAMFVLSAGGWLVALPFAADVDSDAEPVLLAVASTPGAILAAVGVVLLLRTCRPRTR